MNESTDYLIENITKTYEINNAISNMKEEVLSRFDKSIRNSFSEWITGDWICTENENLQDDDCINIIRKEWLVKDDTDEIKSYIWPYLVLEGDDPIWSFFGLPNEKEDQSVCVVIALSDEFKQLQNSDELLKCFDDTNKKMLESAGFYLKGGKVNRWYVMKLFFSNSSILKGLRDDDWYEAHKQLKNAWEIFEKIDWEFMKPAIKIHNKS
ncbi:MAG: hypothetical protein JRG71_01805 [Deltaproteobacteria bacterium]|nr:hypothetical protein [Deltaproteobacteria bacterium]